MNVSGDIAGMTPIQRRDFRLDEKAGAAFRKAKKKIQVLTSQHLVVKKPIGLEDRTTEQGAVQSRAQPAHASRARDGFELRSQCFEPKSFTDDDCNAVVRRELERLTCYPPRRTYVVAIEESNIFPRRGAYTNIPSGSVTAMSAGYKVNAWILLGQSFDNA